MKRFSLKKIVGRRPLKQLFAVMLATVMTAPVSLAYEFTTPPPTEAGNNNAGPTMQGSDGAASGPQAMEIPQDPMVPGSPLSQPVSDEPAAAQGPAEQVPGGEDPAAQVPGGDDPAAQVPGDQGPSNTAPADTTPSDQNYPSPPTSTAYNPAGYTINASWSGEGSTGLFTIQGTQTGTDKAGTITAMEFWAVNASNQWARVSLSGTRTDIEKKGNPGDGEETAGLYLNDVKSYDIAMNGDTLTERHYIKKENKTPPNEPQSITSDDWTERFDGNGNVQSRDGYASLTKITDMLVKLPPPSGAVQSGTFKEEYSSTRWNMAANEAQWSEKDKDTTEKTFQNGRMTLHLFTHETSSRSYELAGGMITENGSKNTTRSEASAVTGKKTLAEVINEKWEKKFTYLFGILSILINTNETTKSRKTWWDNGNIKNIEYSYAKKESGIVKASFSRDTTYREDGGEKSFTVIESPNGVQNKVLAINFDTVNGGFLSVNRYGTFFSPPFNGSFYSEIQNLIRAFQALELEFYSPFQNQADEGYPMFLA